MRILLFMMVIGAISISKSTNAAVLYVDTTGFLFRSFSTIQSAIDAAAYSGDTILIAPIILTGNHFLGCGSTTGCNLPSSSHIGSDGGIRTCYQDDVFNIFTPVSISIVLPVRVTKNVVIGSACYTSDSPGVWNYRTQLSRNALPSGLLALNETDRHLLSLACSIFIMDAAGGDAGTMKIRDLAMTISPCATSLPAFIPIAFPVVVYVMFSAFVAMNNNIYTSPGGISFRHQDQLSRGSESVSCPSSVLFAVPAVTGRRCRSPVGVIECESTDYPVIPSTSAISSNIFNTIGYYPVHVARLSAANTTLKNLITPNTFSGGTLSKLLFFGALSSGNISSSDAASFVSMRFQEPGQISVCINKATVSAVSCGVITTSNVLAVIFSIVAFLGLIYITCGYWKWRSQNRRLLTQSRDHMFEGNQAFVNNSNETMKDR